MLRMIKRRTQLLVFVIMEASILSFLLLALSAENPQLSNISTADAERRTCSASCQYGQDVLSSPFVHYYCVRCNGSLRCRDGSIFPSSLMTLRIARRMKKARSTKTCMCFCHHIDPHRHIRIHEGSLVSIRSLHFFHCSVGRCLTHSLYKCQLRVLRESNQATRFDICYRPLKPEG